jgi:hypothetical protein
MRGKTLRCAVAMAAAALLGACASAPEYPGAHPDVLIVVDNTHTAISSLTVDLVPEFGSRERLGTVRMNERKEFRVRRTKTVGRFRLLAEPLAGDKVYSSRFALNDGDRIAWDLLMNSVYFEGNRAGR